MCLSVPMKIEEVEGLRARCTAMGEERWVDLTLMSQTPPKAGEYIIVHLNFAQRVVSQQDAEQSYALFDEIIQKLG